MVSNSDSMPFKRPCQSGRQEEHAPVSDDAGPGVKAGVPRLFTLEELGAKAPVFEVFRAEREATERVSYDRVFRPEERVPRSRFSSHGPWGWGKCKHRSGPNRVDQGARRCAPRITR